MSVNKVILVGNVGRDPETKYTQSGTAITNFSVATSERWRDKNTNEQNEQTEWHNIVCFARTAEIAAEYLRKGSKVYIEGQLRTQSWEQDGQKRYRTEINARQLQMLSPPRDQPPAPRSNSQQPSAPELDLTDDDIPF